MDDSQTYNYDHPEEQSQQRSSAYNGMADGATSYGQQAGYSYQDQRPQHSAYQYQQSQFEDPERGDDDDDMW